MVAVTVVPSPRDRRLVGRVTGPRLAPTPTDGQRPRWPSVGLRELTAGAVAAGATWLLLGEPGLVAAVLLVVGWTLLALACRRPAAVLAAPARPPYRAVAVVAFAEWVASTVQVDAGLVGTAPLLVFTVVAAAGSTAVGLLTGAVRTPPLPVLVVGDETDVLDALQDLKERSDGRMTAVGGCTPDQLEPTLDQLAPAAVLAVPGAELHGRSLQRLGWLLEERGLPLLVNTRLGDVAPQRTSLTRIGSLGLLEVRPSRCAGVVGAAKHLWERFAAACALLLLAPLLLALMLWVRLDSPGPALFRQTRVGRAGRPFTMLKLRTMRCDAEEVRGQLASEGDGVLFKIRRDPRVTRSGRFLRTYSLDELPQLINVVLGQMSLVGPRPALPDEVEQYDADPRRRLAVKPGLTGLWQVSGRSDLSWTESVRLDLDYVDNWSLSRDLAIVARTFRAVFSHRGAY